MAQLAIAVGIALVLSAGVTFFSARFWWGVVTAGIAAPLVLLGVAPGHGLAAALAAVLALAGLWTYEDLWVKAGQSIPLS